MRNLLSASLFVVAIAAALPASGQTQRSGGGGASPQIMQQYQQLAAERTTLKADNERLKKEADDAKAELAALRKERDALKAGAGGANAELEKLKNASASSEQALAETRRKLEEVVARFKEVATTLRTVETERTLMQQELAKTSSEFDTCVVRNAGMYDLNSEVLTRWEHEGFFARLARSDDFTRLKRTQLENLVDDYRARAAALKVRQPVASPAPASVESRAPQ